MKDNRNYTVFFEIGGKKLKTKVMAENKADAIIAVQNKIIIHKVEINPEDEFNQAMDLMDRFSDILK